MLPRGGLSNARSLRGLGLAALASLAFVAVVGNRALARTARPARVLDSYSLYRPSTLSRAKPAPLVVGCCIGAALETQTQLNEAADRNGFVVAYIAPTKLYNDAERQRGPGPPFPDIQYLSSVIDAVRVSENIDPTRVYVTGASQGGVVSYRAACYLSDKVAAIASVAGWDVAAQCRPKRPVSIIEIHETGDPFVPYSLVPATVAKWRDVDNCPAASTTTTSPGVKDQVWANCAHGTSVELISVTGTGHGWIHANNGVDATSTIWHFFAAHPQVSTAVTLSFVRVRVVYRPHRRVLVSLALGQPSTVQAKLVHGRRALVRASARSTTGKLSLSLKIPASARPGKYSVVAVARASGGTRQIARTIHLTH